MSPRTAHDDSVAETDRLFRLSNPVSSEDLPEPHSPSGEALHDRVLELAARESENDTRRRRLSRASGPWLGRRLGVATVVAAAVAVAIAFLPGRVADESRVDVVQQALAAVSGGQVLHAIVENADSQAILVDLASGEETIERERHEYWYDEARGQFRVRLTIGSEVLYDVHDARLSGPPPSQRALSFATRYREALETEKARVIRRETVEGRKAVVLRIDVPAWKDPRSGEVVQPSYVEEVAVNADSFEPLGFRHLPGPEVGASGPDVVPGPVHWWRVLTIESIDRDERDFRRGPPRLQWRMFAPSNDKEVSRAQAATALGRPALWPGRQVNGVELDRLGLVTSTITWLDGRVSESPSLLIRYGPERPGSRDWIWLSVGTSGVETPRFGPLDGEAVPEGKVRLAFAESRDDRSIDMWFGNVQRDGLYINMQSPRRELIVEAAKTLKPIG